MPKISTRLVCVNGKHPSSLLDFVQEMTTDVMQIVRLLTNELKKKKKRYHECSLSDYGVIAARFSPDFSRSLSF